jgi:hypothetical protein
MANTNIDLVGLDFTSLKNNLKTFLKNNTSFKDLDYEGSNINVLLDVLAYNSYLNAFYTNMVASEMFLDSAQLRDSIVSHAKELNYVPRSFVSAKATIDITVTPAGNTSSVFIPKNTSFTSRVGSNTFTFVTNDSYVTAANGASFVQRLDLYEGSIKTESFVINYSNTSQRFVLSNPTIDTASLEVAVYEDNGQTTLVYTRAATLYNLNETSRVFFIQAAQNQQYEIIFGDGVFGRKPKDGSTFVAKYRACSGELPNGARVFDVDGPIDGHSNVVVTTIDEASGGAVAESIESIRFNAPRSFQAQNRAVTATDYETLLKSQFSDIQSISVYGGEDSDPPQYGKVFISVDVAQADGAPELRKKAYLDFIKDKTPLSMQVNFIDPLFLYASVETTVQFDVNMTTKTTNDIETLVKAAISNYNITKLSNFKKTLYYSQLVNAIDRADPSIVSNDTVVKMIARVTPPTNVPYPFTVSINNQVVAEEGKKLEVDETHYGHGLTSSFFTYEGSRCSLVDDSLGNIHIALQEGETIRIIKKVGTIDYTKGRVVVEETFEVSAYEGNFLELIFKTVSKNLETKNNAILSIDNLDVNVTAVGVKQ